MRLGGYTIAAVLVAVTTAHADMCVTLRSHTDSYYYGGRVTPAEDRETEAWIGMGRVAYVSPDRQVIVDLAKNTLTFVNRKDSTYVEAPLPFDWATLVNKDMLGTLARYRTHGAVEMSNTTQKIHGWKCRGYEITSWINTDEGKYNERDSKIWVTRDLPLDWEKYRAMNAALLKLMNYEDALVASLDSIPGFVVRTEAQRYIHGFSVGSVEEVVDVQELTPGAHVYDVPVGFTQKESLTMADLRG